MERSDQSDDERWQAVLRREATADGRFYYAVATTGVYCRPACPSRRPKRENVSFFETIEAAQSAGFRPCRRCEPHKVSTQQRVVAHVQRLLQTAETAPSLAELAETVGLSPFYLQRLFKRATGLSPKEYASLCRMDRLKAGLKQGATVTAALYEAGYGSSRALYDQAQQQLGMTPSAYRRGGAGERIAYATAETPLGRILVAATDRGVCALRFGETEPALVTELEHEFPRAGLVHDPDGLEPYVKAVRAHLSGRQTSLDFPLDVRATAFQQQVWNALRSIPYGEVRSYREVAGMIGEPTAVRAVARACATNPVALAIPCHRVLRASGHLSGYRWGIDRKRVLLDREQAFAEGRRPSP